jgi:hypothetical protein
MPEPQALCIEDLTAAPGRPRFISCTALVGPDPGLLLTEKGEVLWQGAGAGAGAIELWVSQDDRLILYLRAGGPSVSVHRTGRAYEVPEEKPVVLLDGDELEVGARRLRLHLHGATDEVAPPEPLPERARPGLARVAAAALALGTVVGGPAAEASPEDAVPLEVRSAPPKMARPKDDAGVAKPPPKKPAPKKPAPKKPDQKEEGSSTITPLEVRNQPPAPRRVRPDAGTPQQPQPKPQPPAKKPAPK